MSTTTPVTTDTRVPVAAAVRERLAPRSLWLVAVWLGSAIYAALLTAESVADHNRFQTGFDTAIYDQVLWLLANGHEPFSTVASRPILADHFQPALFFLTPVYWLGLDIPGLYALQSIGLALTSPALFALARTCGASAAQASLPAFLWLVCPWVSSVNLFEFRPTAFAPVLIVLSVLAALRGRDVLLWVSFLLALTLKEDVALTYLVLAVLIAYKGRRRLAAAMAAVSIGWFVAASLIIESLGGSYEAFGQRYAGDRGESVSDALIWSLQHPLDTLSHVWSESAASLVLLLLSSGGLALLAPVWLLLALPTVVYNSLSWYTPQHGLDEHYHLGALVGMFAAVAVGVHRLSALGHVARLVATAGATLGLGVVLVGGVHVHSPPATRLTLDEESAERALAVIDPDAPVAAVLPLLPHLSQREEIYTLPEPFTALDWGSSLTPREYRERASRVRYVAWADGYQAATFYTGRIGRETAVADVRPLLTRLGFVVVARSGPLEILERK
jgi:uncharacterized membrane protein